jgi:hypothetical protein
MELVKCPYADERLGRPMNTSALDQIKRHLKSALSSVASFHAMVPPDVVGWERMSMAVLDLLVAPAVFVVSREGAVLPASVAVGHKLAAGYFDVLKRVLRAELSGRPREPTVEGVLELVREERALIGASEVCAGPPKLIRRTTEVLLHGRPGACSGGDEERVAIARRLFQQLVLGLAWVTFDHAVEAELLGLTGEVLTPRNRFIEHEALARIAELGHEGAAWLRPGGRLLEEIPARLRAPVVLAIEGHDTGCGRFEARAELERLHEPDASALYLRDRVFVSEIAARFASYVDVYRALWSSQWQLESELNRLLGRPASISASMGTLAVPRPRAWRWFETCLGVRARLDVATMPPTVRVRRRHKPAQQG